MATEKQIAANRLNAQHSTGPRTPEGLAKTSQNALTHGLTARQTVISNESEEGYDQHAQALLEEQDPATPTECLLVDQMIAASWRIRRIRIIEARLYQQRVEATFMPVHAEDPDNRIAEAFRRNTDDTSLERAARQEARLERSFFKVCRTAIEGEPRH
jgi:hypothetical protein